uniref:Zn(2)-C6 fungal-type domain-containing protein n=1 Tax=Pyricularia oryzae (strain P131) TaxID=1143193 RepID=L7J819_PYRO1
MSDRNKRGRVNRPSSSSLRRERLADNIACEGFEVMPCAFCSSRGLSCRMIATNSRCSECVRRGRKCDASAVPVSNLGRLTQEKKKLELQESEVEDEILRLQRASAAAFNRLLRLRKQKRLLQSRSEVEASRLGAELDREDASERERLGVDELPVAGSSESEVVPDLQALGHVDLIDWDSVFPSGPVDWDAVPGFGVSSVPGGTPGERRVVLVPTMKCGMSGESSWCSVSCRSSLACFSARGAVIIVLGSPYAVGLNP